MKTFFALVVSLSLFASPALGQSRDDLSRIEKIELIKRIDAGSDAYENGDFERALREYTRAYEILPDPGFHYRIALANERLGRDEAALEQYRLYLEKRPDAEKRGQVERTIEQLESAIAEKSLAREPEPKTETEPGKDATSALQMQPENTVERSLLWPITATSVAAGSTAVTVVALVLYGSASDDLEQIRASPRQFDRDEAEDAAAEANLFQTLTWAFGAASVVTISWAIYEWTRDDEPAAEAAASLTLTPLGPAARVRW